MPESLRAQAEKLRQRAEEYRIYAENCAYADARAAYVQLAEDCDALAARLVKRDQQRQ